MKNSHRGSHTKRVLAGVAVWFVAVVAVPPRPDSVAAWAPKDAPSKFFSWVGACESVDQLDCVESVGAYINGNFVAGRLTTRLHSPGSEYVDGKWVPIERDEDWWGWYTREWEIPGLVNEDGTALVQTRGTIAGSNTIDERCSPLNPSQPCAPMFSVNVEATRLDNFKVPWESKSTNCAFRVVDPQDPLFGLCTRAGFLQAGVKFRVVVRSSWTLPSVVVSKSDQTVVNAERLPTSGAHRVTVEGIPYNTVGLGPGVDWRNDRNSRASWNDRIIKMQIIDGRLWRSGQYSKCATQPPLIVADNSWAPSVPTFDTNNGLELNVSNSHYDTDGKTPFEGRYNGFVPLPMASCLWGDNLSSKSQFVAEVIESSTGEKKAATTAVSVDGTALRINAAGFTFSSPTIRVRYVPPVAGSSGTSTTPKQAVATGKSKSTTITCVKGRTVRKVTGLRPRCPAGFKKT